MLFGILKSGKVQLKAIGRALQESIPLKQTTKRLGQHLGIAGLWLTILDSALQTQRSYLFCQRSRNYTVWWQKVAVKMKRYYQRLSG